MTDTTAVKPRGANEVDRHVGERLRVKRIERGLSQTDLGDRLGITFQQIQKYEKGSNRIGASRLWAISEVLEVPVEWFFDGMVALKATRKLSAEAGAMTKFIESRDGLKFVLALNEIEESDVRRQLLSLIRTIAGLKS